MAIEETKVITRYIADTSQERAAIDQLIRKTEQLKQTKAQESKASEQHFDQLVLDLTRANNGVVETTTSWVQLNEKTFSFAGAVQKVAKTMAPWNQAVELGGRLINGLSDSMDAYGKTSAAAAKEVNKLKTEFEGYRDSVMQSIGRLSVELLKPAVAFDEQYKALLKIGNSPAFKLLYGDKGLARGGAGGFKASDFTPEQLEIAKRYGVTFDQAKDPIDGVARAFAGVKSAIREGVDYWNTDGKTFVDSFTAGMSKAGKAAREALTVSQLVNSRGQDFDFDVSGSDVLGQGAFQNYQGFAIDEQKLLEQVSGGHLANYEEMTSRDSRYTKFVENRNAGYLETALGPIETFDAYQQSVEALGGAFEAFGGAVGASYEAIVTGSGSVGAAFKQMFASGLMAMGKSSAIEALRETALGFGKLALGPIGGIPASMHFKSAALHAGVAVAAGVAAAALGAGSRGGSASAPAAAGDRPNGGSVSGGGRNAGGSESTRPIVMIVGSQFDELTPRQRRQKADEAWDRARRERDE